MNNNDEPRQIELLLDMDVPMHLLQQPQRLTKANKLKTQAQVLLGDAAGEIAQEAHSHSDETIAQPTSEWERSQEFTVSAGTQSVQVVFKAFYFFSSHHFEFRGETISPTGYRSDFLDIKQANRWRSPIEYAIEKAQVLNAELRLEQKKRQRSSKLKAPTQRNEY